MQWAKPHKLLLGGSLIVRSYHRAVPGFVASASCVALLSACAVKPIPFTEAELRSQAQADRAEMFAESEPVSGPLSLPQAIARALKYNLDNRTKMMEQALALGQTKIDRWDLLPRLVANAGYAGRSEPEATQSRDLVTQTTGNGNPTYSKDRELITADLTLSWNVLDFGVSYFTAHQNADRSLIAEERRRRTVHTLVQEVRSAYWRAVASQVLETDVRAAVSMAEQALADARRVEQAGLKNPADMLRYQKTLLEVLRQLEGLSQELATARLELSSLINVPPGSSFALEVPPQSAFSVPLLTLPVETMEEIAFINNADLREQAYHSRIAADETRKTILRLLPGLSFNVGRNYDSNSFLIANHWTEAGAKVTWNLFNLLSAPDQVANAEAAEAVANARRVALRMAVLAQVHVAYRQYLNAGRQFERADELFKVEQRLANVTALRAENDAQSTMERIAGQTSAIAAALRRYQTYSQVEAAVGKLNATMGRDLLPPALASRDLPALTDAVASGLSGWSRGADAVLPEERVPAGGTVEARPPSGQEAASAGPVNPPGKPETGHAANRDAVTEGFRSFGAWLEKGRGSSAGTWTAPEAQFGPGHEEAAADVAAAQRDVLARWFRSFGKWLEQGRGSGVAPDPTAAPSPKDESRQTSELRPSGGEQSAVDR